MVRRCGQAYRHPAKIHRKTTRARDKDLYRARNLIEKFFAGSNNSALSLQATTNARRSLPWRDLSRRLHHLLN